MPAYEIFAPIAADNSKLIVRGKEYSIDLSTMAFTRVGEDGNIIILPLFGGDEFIGEVLEGQWKKFWNTDMDADQAFTAILDGSGTLEFEGEADVAGTKGVGTLISSHIMPLLNGLEFTLAISVPVDDSGVTANRDIALGCYLVKNYVTGANPYQDNMILFYFDVTETGLRLVLGKRIGGVNTYFHVGPDAATNDNSYATGDLEAVIWRLVVQDGDPAETGVEAGRHLHAYIKQSDTLDNAELATEDELVDSPFDISDLLMDVVYPSLYVSSANTTYFDSGNEAKAAYARVSYPTPIRFPYDVTAANRLLNEVELWDGDPSSGGVKVYDVDYDFTNNPYLQNGLVRLIIQTATQYSLFYYYEPVTGAYATDTVSVFDVNLDVDNVGLDYWFLEKILYLSPEKIELRIKVCDTATNDDDYFTRFTLTLTRGRTYLTAKDLKPHPIQGLDINLFGASLGHFGYVGDDAVGDDDLNITGNNTTLSDNFMEMFDPNRDEVLHVAAVSRDPNGDFQTYQGRYLSSRDIDADRVEGLYIMGYTPFALVSNLFEEAEDATLVGGATIVDPDALASNLKSVLLDAQNEYVGYELTAITDLPAGRYLVVFRAKDTNQVASDLRIYVWNSTDGTIMNQENAFVWKTLTATYAFYSIVFDISAEDSGDTFRPTALKSTADANDIYVDYILIIPIGDGESFPQDIAHTALRSLKQERRLFNR